VIHLDTSFLVDLLRERGRRQAGRASRLLETLQREDLWVSVHVACELQAGVELSQRSEVERKNVGELLGSLQIAVPTDRFPEIYGHLLAHLQRRGERIDTMDLLIATAAVVAEASLVTGNPRHFSRIPGLEILTY
jgi:predicted nucleic acid-binding protein